MAGSCFLANKDKWSPLGLTAFALPSPYPDHRTKRLFPLNLLELRPREGTLASDSSSWKREGVESRGDFNDYPDCGYGKHSCAALGPALHKPRG